LRRDVASDAALVSIRAQIISGLSRVFTRTVRQKRGAPSTGVVTGAWALNFNHVCP